MKIHIDHVQIAAPPNSERTAREYYGILLRLKEIEKPKNLKQRGGVWFKVGCQELHIGIEKNFIPAKKAHIAFYVEDINFLKEKIAEKSFQIVEDDSLPGYDRFYSEDPFGNRIEFICSNY